MSQVLSENFRKTLDAFLDILPKIHPHRKEYKWYRDRKEYSYTVAIKYAHIWAPHHTWRVSLDGGLYHWKFLRGPYGNIFEIVGRFKESAKIKWDGDQSIVIEGQECEVCGRTEFVIKTIVGFRCRFCRGADQRHINLVRQLGGVPTFQGKPIHSLVE